jgi:hypothetical protein
VKAISALLENGRSVRGVKLETKSSERGMGKKRE